jgi:bifunctional glutamyl/prolyl-tRNA synthetase
MERAQVQSACEEYEAKVNSAGIKVRGDYRKNYSLGWKFHHWELKGVHVRIELGLRDLKANQIVAVRRDTGEKIKVKSDRCVIDIHTLLSNIQRSLFVRAKRKWITM